MKWRAWSVVLALALSLMPQRSGIERDIDQRTLDAALALANLTDSRFPVTLVSTVPPEASQGIEAWTRFGTNGSAERVFVYTGSDIFRCARWPLSMHQCLVRLASVLVHEAWHFEHGKNQAAAYDAQIAFLMANRATAEHIAAVRTARERVLALEQRAREAAIQRYAAEPADSRQAP